MQKNDLLLAKSKLYKTLQYFVFPALVAFCLAAPLFHQYDFAKPSLWMSVYAGVHRLVVTSFLVVGFLLLMFAERDSFFGRLRSSKLLENAFYRVLGRLSFGFYLIHMSVMKIVYGNQHEAQRISFPLVVSLDGMVFASSPIDRMSFLPQDHGFHFGYVDNIRASFGSVHFRGETVRYHIQAFTWWWKQREATPGERR